MEQYLEILYDDENLKFDIVGESTNDTLFTHNVSEMQRAKMKVHCQLADVNTEFSDEHIGYRREKDLYNKLLTNYETRTGIALKRW